jgi:hypothetical protein
MALQIENYNFKGLTASVYMRVDRIFGSSKEGWNSLVGVYNITIEDVPAVEASEGVEAQEATTKTVYNKLEEFNHSTAFVETERGYVSLYNSLKAKYGGIDV